MKKFSALFMAVLLLMLAVLPVSAASSTFVDEIEDGFPKADTFSDHMYYQYNSDCDCTVLVKQSDTNDATQTEYITWKMNDNIRGFSLEAMCVAGLGDPWEDISVFVSADGKSWTQVETSATELTYDDEIYISFDMAYWHLSTITNKGAIPAGNRYFKVQFNGCMEDIDVTWNVMIDTVTIELGDAPTTTTKAPTTTKATTTKATTTTTTTTEAEVTTTTTESTVPSVTEPSVDADTEKPESNTPWGIIIAVIVVVVLAAGGTAAFLIIKKKKQA